MSLENVVATVLSVEFLFGASTAIAFRKAITGLFTSVIGRASGQASDEDTADRSPPN